MYSVTITHTRPSADIPFYWETSLADHVAYQAKLESHYNGYINMGDHVYSEDRLTVTNLYTGADLHTYYIGHDSARDDPELIAYWVRRDAYYYDNNITRELITN